MDERDLRVGNLVINPFGAIVSIDEIHKSGVKFRTTLYSLVHCKPIPLAEEWLIKMGFYKDEYISYRWYYKSFRTLAYDLDDNCVRIGDNWDFAKAIYVHQMQNLIYALTNEELTIKNRIMEFKGTKSFNVDYHTTGRLPYKYIVSDIQETDEEAQANALLISKSPELLEMLKDIFNTWEGNGNFDNDYFSNIKQLIKEATEL